MLGAQELRTDDAFQDRISDYYLKDEADLLPELSRLVELSVAERASIAEEATRLVRDVRSDQGSITVFDKLLQEYGLSTHEGVQLMRLAEALIRTPDFDTRRLLIRDKIGNADWASHAGQSESFFVNQATNGLRFTRGWVRLTGHTDASGVAAKFGDRVLVAAMNRAMKTMGKHFVLGRDIAEAIQRSEKSSGTAYSYDMLGEAARTEADAEKYFEVYLRAIQTLAAEKPSTADEAIRPGLSVKLSALHPRFELAQKSACLPILIERMKVLCSVAAKAGLWINIDAEECDRTELTLDVFKALLEEDRLADWEGLGLVIQAYQRRALPVIDCVVDLARSADRRIAVRLVKGAYWDSEVKRAQELGLSDFPVFTRKENTDVSYIACAVRLLDAVDVVFPQFATHNAHTAVTVARLAGARHFEFQRLHGMGEGLHKILTETYGALSRVYAPVGKHRELLPYLVRRLLENGANSSFVNQMFDEDIDPSCVASDPFFLVEQNDEAVHPSIPRPQKIVGAERDTASGHDLTQKRIAKHFETTALPDIEFAAASLINGIETGERIESVHSPQNTEQVIGKVRCINVAQVSHAVNSARRSVWRYDTSPEQRAKILREAANLIEQDTHKFVRLCVLEAGKTLPDAIAEIREAVDFCRYYAAQALRSDVRAREPLGVVACISPWNFPLAIFLGQVTAALSVGNAVVAKPPPQTPLIAYEAVQLLHRAGVPTSALHLLVGDGAVLGTALTRHPDVNGVCFTGSTKTAQIIAKNLADTERLGIPFIAETGGINAMIVDSTSLLEQAVQDTIDSAFQSAGQRCSACRIVCVQSDISEAFISMLTGAMATLTIGDPAKLATDVGPVIDPAAKEKIDAHTAKHRATGRVLFESELPQLRGHFASPTLIAVDSVSDVTEEIFGPVLHLVTFEADKLDAIVNDINALGFGLTMGLHTRIDAKVDDVASRANVGNLYVNRNQIGAVVGVQPFGGEGMSGTGPKAGGPHYLLRLSRSPNHHDSSDLKFDSKFEKQNEADETLKLETFLAEARATIKVVSPNHLDALLSAVKAHFGDTEFGNWIGEILDTPSKWYASKSLPGPTGEQNTLKAAPRGVMLALGGPDPGVLLKQVLKSVLTGNACLVPKSPESEDIRTVLTPLLNMCGLPSAMLQLFDGEQMTALLNAEIDGVILEDADLQAFQRTIANRQGALLPVLSADAEPWEFLLERTVTINTAAAGGNASLFGRL